MEFTIFIIAAAIFITYLSFFTVEQQNVYAIERFGKFKVFAKPGLNFKIPFVDQIAGTLSMRVIQQDVHIETKTLDDVFVHIKSSIQYRVLDNKLYEAFYALSDPYTQIEAFVFDVVRAKVPKIKLDDVFSKKDEIANSVNAELHDVMDDFGYNIISTLVTDIDPDQKVKTAMNEINEAMRMRIAANERGEAEKILKVKAAEAEAESKILQGKGIAGQRVAITEGLRDAITEFQDKISDAGTMEVMNLIMMNQYFDTLKDIGLNSKSNTILIPHSPSGMNDYYSQIRDSIITGNLVTEKNKKK